MRSIPLGDERDIVIKTAEEFKIPYADAEKIIFSQFRFVRKVMEEGKLNKVRIKYLGSFEPIEGRIKAFFKHKEMKKINEECL